MGRRAAALGLMMMLAAVPFAGVAGAVTSSGASVSGWGIEPTPNPPGFASLSGVSCASTATCTAVGFSSPNGKEIVTLAEHWDGTDWAVQPAPDPHGATSSQLTAVSCPTKNDCTAVGYDNASGAGSTLVEHWNGSGWAVQSTTPPAGSSASYLFGVSCPSTRECIAVGRYEVSTDISKTLAERWNGTSWSIELTSNPTGTSYAELLAVSCPSPTTCTAVGDGDSGAGGRSAALAEHWNGTDWAIQTTPSPAGTTDSDLYGVSCPATTTCIAVGHDDRPSAENVTLAERWEGNTWAFQSTPNPSGVKLSTLEGVSCPSTGNCTAAGYSINSGNEEVTLAEHWNGTTWAVQSTPDPTGDGFVAGLLRSASCPSTNACTAAGYYANAGGQKTLVEHIGPQGFWLATASGSVFAAGTAPSLAGTAFPGSDPAVGVAATPDGKGYWLVSADGSVFAAGDAKSYGTLPGLDVHVSDIVAIAPTGDGRGYWMIGRDGGEFAFGDAKYHGSLPGLGVDVHDVVGMVATSNGGGYWVVGADGGIFAFGNAHYVGSLPGLHVKTDDIVAMIPSPTRGGYVLVGSDGGAFVLGSGVHYYGSLPGEHVTVSDIVGLALTPDTDGYWLAGSDGATYPFGDAEPLSVPSSVSAGLPVVGIAAS
jgi:hypothetical protein